MAVWKRSRPNEFATQGRSATIKNEQWREGRFIGRRQMGASAQNAAFGCLPLSLQRVRSRREQVLLLSLLLVLATAVLYEPALHNGFVNYDDPSYIMDNVHVRQGLTWGNIAWSFHAVVAGHWHPVTLMTHMADVQLFGLNPTGHHFASVTLHVLNVVLLFFLLQQATGYLLRSAMVAALFAVFPLNVEPVAWIADRKSVLCTTFLFLALGAYGWYARRPSTSRYLGVVLLFALGLMAKSMLVTLPCALLLLDYWPLNRFVAPQSQGVPPGSRRSRALKLLAEKIPLLFMSAGCVAIAVHSGKQGSVLTPLAALSIAARLKNAVYSYLLYIGKGLWPAQLAVIYPHPGHLLPVWKAVAAGIVLAAITAIVWHYREKRYLLPGWFWYLGTMLPVIGISQAGRQGMADRYAYIPFLGLFVIAVWTVAETAATEGWRREFLVGIALTVLVAYSAVSHVQLGYWHSSYTLFSHAVQVTTANGVAENNLAIALDHDMGRPDLALPHYEAAALDTPQWFTGHYNYGVVLQQRGRFGDAMKQYQQALPYATDLSEASEAYNNLGAIMVQLDRPDEALSQFGAIISMNPGNGLALLNRGIVEYQQKDLVAAQADILQAVKFMPNPKTYFWLGRVMEQRGELKAAEGAYQTALAMAPGTIEIENRLALVRQRLQTEKMSSQRSALPAVTSVTQRSRRPSGNE